MTSIAPLMKIHALNIMKRLLIGLLYTVLGTFVGVIGLYLIILQSRPDLKVWHTAHLEEEFTAAKSKDVKTLADYLALEDRLFQEMETKVYAKTGKDRLFAVNRYQHGALSDPTGYETDFNRSFEWKSELAKAGVLLLHGLSDSPYSLVAQGRQLHQEGLHVLALRMPGHGTIPSGLVHARWQDLAAAVKIGMRHLRSTLGPDKPIYVMGYSTGAALAVDYSLEALSNDELPRAEALVLLSPAIGVSPAASFAKWQSGLSWVLGMEKVAWTDILPEYDPYKYGSFAVNAGDLIHQLTVQIGIKIDALAGGSGSKEFPRTLAMSSAVDATVSVSAVVNHFLTKVDNEGNEFILFDINRLAENIPFLAHDPKAEIQGLMDAESLPFAVRLVTNKNPQSHAMVARVKRSGEKKEVVEDLRLSWPRGIHSLAHVSLPFSGEDPLYGETPGDPGTLHLGRLDARGENGVLNISAKSMLRLRYNPFFTFVEKRVDTFLRL